MAKAKDQRKKVIMQATVGLAPAHSFYWKSRASLKHWKAPLW